MTKALIITEKPSVTRDIVEAIGGFTAAGKNDFYESDEYVCTYAVGHILGLSSPEEIDPKYRRWRLQDLPIIPEKFDLKPIENQEKRVQLIQKLLSRKDISSVINACDAAREGELIFREIVDYAGSKLPVKRLWLQSMTKQAIRDGFTKLRDGKELEGLASAAYCRSYSDWLIGMNATRALTVRLKSKTERGAAWSAGRVQTPTLAILVKREMEILSHEPIPFSRIKANFKTSDHEYEAHWFDPGFKRSTENPEFREDRIFKGELVKKVIEETSGKSGVASESRKAKPRKPPLLFDLTSLQREANSKLGWSAVRTLRAAQRCYEAHKVLTYPRTSSRVLPEDYKEPVQNLLKTLAGTKDYGPHAAKLLKDGLLNQDKVFNDAGVSDHFAIIPTGEIAPLSGDDQRLFDMVTRQFIAAFYPQAVFEEVERITVVGDHSFKSKPPLVLKEPGWLAVFEKEEGKNVKFPPLKVKKDGDKENVDNISVEEEKFRTQPPPRIGEAGLLGLMENAGRQIEDEELSAALTKAEGLGTAATRADIIENLKYKEYVDETLRPTVKGIRLIDVLTRINAGTIASPELTGQLELTLNLVEEGKKTQQEFLQKVEQVTREVVEAARSFDYDLIYPSTDPLGECPKCKKKVFEKAWFYGCESAILRDVPVKACDFLMWKNYHGRYLDRRNARILLSGEATEELDGFKTAAGKAYKAILQLENYQIIRKAGSESDDTTGMPEVTVNEDPLGPCPIHKSKCMVIETKDEFICQNKLEAKKARTGELEGFSLPRVLCKREMTREDAIALLTTGATGYIEDFVSKKGRKFKARLLRGEVGDFTFDFPPREARPKKVKEEAPAQE